MSTTSAANRGPHLVHSTAVDKGAVRRAQVHNSPRTSQALVAHGRMQARYARVVQHRVRHWRPAISSGVLFRVKGHFGYASAICSSGTALRLPPAPRKVRMCA